MNAHAELEAQRQELAAQQILAWISPCNFLLKQKDNLSQLQGARGHWFLDSEQYKRSWSGDLAMLWCSGQRKFIT